MVTGGMLLLWPATQSHRVSFYHVECYSAGNLIFAGDYKQVGVWNYTLDGRELFLPDSGCVTVGSANPAIAQIAKTAR
jgi:hypothetical protein